MADESEDKREGGALLLEDRDQENLIALLGRIVHDINNPLAVIVGFADLLRNPGLSPEKRDRYVTRIYEQAVRLSQFVENMSFFTSIPSMPASRFDLCRAAGEVCALRSGGFQAGGIDLEVQSAGVPVPVCVDRAALVRILHCLLNNVEQVFREDPFLATRRAAVRCRVEGGSGVLEVGDSGPGIPPDQQGKVFQAFYSTRRSGGLGLGLTVSRGLAERMGGSLVLVPEGDAALKGAMFRLCVPLDRGDAGA